MNEELRKEINKIVALMAEKDSLTEEISDIKKAVKSEYEIPIPTINKICTIIRKQSLEEEDEKWQEIKEYVEACS